MTALLFLVATSLANAESPRPSAFEPLLSAPAPGFDLSPSAPPPALQGGPPPEDLNRWKGSVSVGGTIASGNTERKTGTATATVEKRREKDRTSFGLLWNYAQEDDATTQRRTLGTAQYDYFFSEKLYGLAQASAEGDLNAQLELRTILGVGAGYQFLEDEQWKISGEGGLAYVDEDYKDNDADAEFLAARLAYKVDWKPNESWEAGQATEFIPSLEDADDMNARVDTHAKVLLSEKLFAQFQWLFTWDNTPADGAERVDNLYLLTLGWTF